MARSRRKRATAAIGKRLRRRALQQRPGDYNGGKPRGHAESTTTSVLSNTDLAGIRISIYRDSVQAGDFQTRHELRTGSAKLPGVTSARSAQQRIGAFESQQDEREELKHVIHAIAYNELAAKEKLRSSAAAPKSISIERHSCPRRWFALNLDH